jgi:hypothetical protein
MLFGLSLIGQPLTSPAEREILASTPVDFPTPLTLDWILSFPESLAATVRQQPRWTIALSAISLVGSQVRKMRKAPAKP